MWGLCCWTSSSQRTCGKTTRFNIPQSSKWNTRSSGRLKQKCLRKFYLILASLPCKLWSSPVSILLRYICTFWEEWQPLEMSVSHCFQVISPLFSPFRKICPAWSRPWAWLFWKRAPPAPQVLPSAKSSSRRLAGAPPTVLPSRKFTKPH